DPWLRAVLVDRERRRPQAMLRMGLGVRLWLRLRRLPLRSVPVLRLVRRLLVVPKLAKRLQPHAGVRREAGNQAVDVAAGHHRGLSLGVMALGRMTFGQGAAGEAEGEGKSSGDGEQIPLQKDLPTDFAGKIRARVAGYFAARGPPFEEMAPAGERSRLELVIARYSRPAMARIWSDDGKLATWLE